MFKFRLSTCLLNFAILVICLSFPQFISAQTTDDDEVEIDASIVILNAVVTDKSGMLRKRMAIEDFRLKENGVLQKIDFFEAEITNFAAVILLDVSGSMEMRVSLARSAAIKFLEGLRPDDSAAVYSFDTKVKIIQDFSNSRDLHSRAFDLKADGQTSLYDAVSQAADSLSNRPEKRRAIIVLSDGADTRSKNSASKALMAAQNANATIYSVDMSAIATTGSSRLQNQGVLKKFSKETGGVFIKTPGGFEMRNAFSGIVEELGILYTLGYQSGNGKKDGKWREIQLETANAGDKVRTRAGYYATPD